MTPYCRICGHRDAKDGERYCDHCLTAVVGFVRTPSTPKALAALKAIHEAKPKRKLLPWRA